MYIWFCFCLVSFNILKFSKSHWNVNVKGTAYLDQRMVFSLFFNSEWFEVLKISVLLNFWFFSTITYFWTLAFSKNLVAANFFKITNKWHAMWEGSQLYGRALSCLYFFKVRLGAKSFKEYCIYCSNEDGFCTSCRHAVYQFIQLTWKINALEMFQLL